MHPTKASGMDGVTPLFFQSFSDIIQVDICNAVKSFFHSTHLLKSFNHTLLFFISKIQNPTKISHYRRSVYVTLSIK